MDFNPLPRKRENVEQFPPRYARPNFNPLPRKRENLCQTSLFPRNNISIHSLARGRTYFCDRNADFCYNFNPLPRKRENGGKIIKNEQLISLFQSTPSQEGELPRFEDISCCRGFQSTPSQEGEHDLIAAEFKLSEFQSTPSQEGEQIHNAGLHQYNAFQSTPSQEGEHRGDSTQY